MHVLSGRISKLKYFRRFLYITVFPCIKSDTHKPDVIREDEPQNSLNGVVAVAFLTRSTVLRCWPGRFLRYKLRGRVADKNIYSSEGGENRMEIIVYRFLSVVQQPNSDPGSLVVEVSRSHTHTRARWNSSGRVISSSQRPLPTQHTNARHEHPCPQ